MKITYLAAGVLLGSAICTASAQVTSVRPPAPTKAAPSTPLKAAIPHHTVGSGSNALLPPINDGCASPIVVIGNGPHPWTNLTATTDGGPESCGTPNQDVWYTWNATGSGNVTLSLCPGGGPDSVVAVYTGAGCPVPGTAIACNDDFCGLVSQTSFCAIGGNDYTIRIGGFGGATGAGTFTFTVTAFPPEIGNDACGAPTTVIGLGTFPFDNTAATSRCEGQTESLCLSFGSTVINHDVWFTWNSPQTAAVTVNTCGLTAVDTKIAIYDGVGCPGAPAIACNDDACPGFQSTLSFTATSGNDYTIQLGTFPGASGGTGMFEITIPPPPGPCDVYDDGSTEQAIGLTAGGEVIWIHKQGAVGGGTTSINSISTAWGDPNNPGFCPGNTTPAKVAIWDDPNDDGNPSDAVLLQLVNTTVQNVDTNTLNVTALSPPVTVSGVYFIGAGLAHPAGDFVAPQDTGSTSSGRAWIAGDTSGTANYATLSANNVPPLDPDTAGLPGVWLLRCECSAVSATPVCFGDGTGAPCPCLNTGDPGHGCANSSHTEGAQLLAGGTSTLTGDSLTLTNTFQVPSSLTIFLQGTLSIPAVSFGDGLRCTGGTLKRIYKVKFAHADTVAVPNGGPCCTASVSSRSATLGDPISGGSTRYYQAWYRDPIRPFCVTGDTFNISNGLAVIWGF